MRKTWGVLTLLAASLSAQHLRVTNAASFLTDDDIAPGSIVSILGKDLADTTVGVTDPANPPSTLGGVTVTVAGKTAPLYYVSPRQINARIPATVAVGSAELVVNSPLGVQRKTINVDEADPGIFSSRGSGSRDGAVLDAVTFDTSPFRAMRDGQPAFLAIYATGLNLAAAPTVSIGGVSVPVQWYGDAPCCMGLQQINVRLVPQLAGAGRVPVAVTSGGKTSNIVEIVLLPEKGQGAPQPSEGRAFRAREIATLAWIPGTTQLLLADENDSVLRILDAKERKVLSTIALPDGSHPGGIAVWTAGLAAVSLRNQGKVSIVDLAQKKVLREVTVGTGPAGIAVAGNNAVVANQEGDSVSIFDVTAAAPVVKTVAVGRAPYSADPGLPGLVLVANQLGGTLSVVNASAGTVVDTIPLGAGVRPHTVRALPGLVPWAIVTDPTATPSGRVLLVNLTTKAVVPVDTLTAGNSGGLSDVAVLGRRAFFANQTGGMVVAALFKMDGASAALESSVSLQTGLGARAVAVDPAGVYLAVTNQGSGTVTIIDLASWTVTGNINAVRSENDDDDETEHGDRERAANAPVVTALAPNQGVAGTTITKMTITGTNLAGASEVEFRFPAGMTMPPSSQGRGRGPESKEDKNITATNIAVNAAGTQLTVDVTLAAGATKGDRVVRVETPNGESAAALKPGNTFTVK